MSTEPDWAAIAADYYNDMPVDEMCLKFGITKRKFYIYSENNGWLLQDGTTTPKRLKNRKTMMLVRIGTIIENVTTSLENRMSNTTCESSLDIARDANTVRMLVILLEKLTTLEKQGEEETTPATGVENDQAERLRTGLAKRLENIQERTD
ncbi:MAG: hypothetical protein ACRBBN_20905 [Methyloligellaceae bacterium]